jgi:hypothetical protein
MNLKFIAKFFIMAIIGFMAFEYFYHIKPFMVAILNGEEGLRPFLMNSDTSVYLKLYRENDLYAILSDFAATKNSYGPVLLLNIFSGNCDFILLFYCGIFLILLLKINKYFNVNIYIFTALFLLNPLNSMYLLSVNKDILTVFIIIFLSIYAISSKIIYIIISLILSLVCKFEITLFIFMYYLISQFDRKMRWIAIICYLGIITFSYSHIPGMDEKILVVNAAQNAKSVGITLFANDLSMNYYLYPITIIPMFLMSILEGIINYFKYDEFNIEDFPIFISSVLTLSGLLFSINKLKFNINNNFILMILLFILIISLVPFPHHRYIYPLYTLFILAICSKNNNLFRYNG